MVRSKILQWFFCSYWAQVTLVSNFEQLNTAQSIMFGKGTVQSRCCLGSGTETVTCSVKSADAPSTFHTAGAGIRMGYTLVYFSFQEVTQLSHSLPAPPPPNPPMQFFPCQRLEPLCEKLEQVCLWVCKFRRETCSILPTLLENWSHLSLLLLVAMPFSIVKLLLWYFYGNLEHKLE